MFFNAFGIDDENKKTDEVVDGDATELENLSSALKNFSGGDGK